MSVHDLVRAQLVKHLAEASLTVALLESKRRSTPSSTGTHAQHLRLGRRLEEAKAIRDAWNDVLMTVSHGEHLADDFPGVPE